MTLLPGFGTAHPLVGILAATMTLIGPARFDADLEVSQTREIDAPPAAVWAIVGGFCDLRRWQSRIRTCELRSENGQLVRNLSVRGLGRLAEFQIDRDDERMTYSYGLADGPWPVKRYWATLAVAPRGAAAVVTLRATFRLQTASDGGALGYGVAGWDPAGLPPLSLGYVSLIGFALLTPLSVLTARYGVSLANRLSKRRLEVALAAYLIFVSARFAVSLLETSSGRIGYPSPCQRSCIAPSSRSPGSSAGNC